MGAEAVTGELIKQGLLGALLVLALWVAWKKDRQVGALHRRLIEKAEKDAEKYYQFAMEMTTTMKALTDAITKE